jgi:hypothetical protein
VFVSYGDTQYFLDILNYFFHQWSPVVLLSISLMMLFNVVVSLQVVLTAPKVFLSCTFCGRGTACMSLYSTCW